MQFGYRTPGRKRRYSADNVRAREEESEADDADGTEGEIGVE